ncbi:MAG: antibiotic biosynthesis monooxygenase [Polyangiaceae bacterium]
MDEPSKYVIVFRSRLMEGAADEYAARAAEVYALARQMPGFLASKDFVAEDGERLAVIEFDSAEHLAAWRDHMEHRAAQAEGRSRWYRAYHIQVCKLERESRFERAT